MLLKQHFEDVPCAYDVRSQFGVPLRIPLGALSDFARRHAITQADLLGAYIESEYDALSARVLSRSRADGWVLILDGFDEMSEDAQRQMLACLERTLEIEPQHHLLLTSRPTVGGILTKEWPIINPRSTFKKKSRILSVTKCTEV